MPVSNKYREQLRIPVYCPTLLEYLLLHSGKAYSEPRKLKRQRQQPETRENKPIDRHQDKNCASIGLTYSVSMVQRMAKITTPDTDSYSTDEKHLKKIKILILSF